MESPKTFVVWVGMISVTFTALDEACTFSVRNDSIVDKVASLATKEVRIILARGTESAMTLPKTPRTPGRKVVSPHSSYSGSERSGSPSLPKDPQINFEPPPSSDPSSPITPYSSAGELFRVEELEKDVLFDVHTIDLDADTMDTLKKVEATVGDRLEAMEEIEEEIDSAWGPDHQITFTTALSAFNNRKAVGFGSYGVVGIGCVKQDGGCLQTKEKALPAYVAFKVLRFSNTVETTNLEEFNNFAVSTYWGKDKSWNGSKSILRETLVSRLMSHLVSARITPHTVITFKPRITKDSPCIDKKDKEKWKDCFAKLDANCTSEEYAKGVCIAMELNSTGGRHWIKAVADKRSVLTPTQRFYKVQTMFLQLLQCLVAAETHIQLRHNDLHQDNIMMNTIPEGRCFTYRMLDYSTDPPTPRAYRIPCRGMLWKVVDFGFSTAGFIHPEDNHWIWYHHVNSYLTGHAAKLEQYKELVHKSSPDFYDVVRLVSTIGRYLKGSKNIEALEYIDKIQGSIKDFSFERGGDAEALRFMRRPQRHEALKGHLKFAPKDSLIRRLFHTFAAEFLVEIPEDYVPGPQETVFDTDGAFINTLDAFDKEYFRVVEGKIAPRPRMRREPEEEDADVSSSSSEEVLYEGGHGSQREDSDEGSSSSFPTPPEATLVI